MQARIKELDALRGIAALSVVLFHFTIRRDLTDVHFDIGCMGVDLFFIISGFVIFMTIEKAGSWKDFIWSRFTRLYPSYWACVTITSLFVILKYKFLVQAKDNDALNSFFIKYLFNMSMFQHYFNIKDIDGPYWTLAIELSFYILMTVALLTKAIKVIDRIGLIFILLCTTYSFSSVSNNLFLQKISFAVPLICYAPLFYAGIMLYKMKFDRITAIRMFIFILTLLLQSLLFTNCYRNNNVITIYQYVPGLILIYSTFIFFLFGKLGFILNPITIWLGKISYSLYLIHQFVGIELLMPSFIKVMKFNFWLSGAITLVIVIFLAALINKYIEVPAMVYLRKINPFKKEIHFAYNRMPE